MLLFFLENQRIGKEGIEAKPLPNDPEAAYVGFCRKRRGRRRWWRRIVLTRYDLP